MRLGVGAVGGRIRAGADDFAAKGLSNVWGAIAIAIVSMSQRREYRRKSQLGQPKPSRRLGRGGGELGWAVAPPKVAESRSHPIVRGSINKRSARF